MKHLILSGFIFMQVIAIGPNDVKPGDWFTPTNSNNVKQEQEQLASNEAFNQLVCALNDKKDCK